MAGDAGQLRTIQLADRDNIGACSQLLQQVDDREILIGLDRISDDVLLVSEAFLVGQKGLPDGPGTVDIKRQANLTRQVVE